MNNSLSFIRKLLFWTIEVAMEWNDQWNMKAKFLPFEFSIATWSFLPQLSFEYYFYSKRVHAWFSQWYMFKVSVYKRSLCINEFLKCTSINSNDIPCFYLVFKTIAVLLQSQYRMFETSVLRHFKRTKKIVIF